MTMNPLITHFTAIQRDDVYYGWPANHGAWQRGDEFLVGVASGAYDESAISKHNVSGPIAKGLLRSYDGGFTWDYENPCDFMGYGAHTKPTAFTPDSEIYRVCGFYDYGGEGCDEYGSIYSSKDFGKTWHGPFIMKGLDWLYGWRQRSEYGGWISTSRTCVVRDLIFLSAAKKNYFGSDFVICAQIRHSEFRFLSVIKPFNGTRCACPSACLDDRGNVYVACRRRNLMTNENWIELYKSVDCGLTWESVSIVGSTGTRNGNPPSFKYLPNGRMVCAFANRKTQKMMLAVSDDYGTSWKHLKLRDNLNGYDFGYPQLFVKQDGDIVCVYYWQNDDGVPNSIEVSHIRL